MFVKLTADRRVVLEDRDNFRAFKLVVEGRREDLDAVRQRAGGHRRACPTPTPPGYRKRRCGRGRRWRRTPPGSSRSPP